MKKKITKTQELETLFINECFSMVPDIYRDTTALFRESGERMTKAALLDALTELSMEQVDFKGQTKLPAKSNYDDVCKKLKALIKKEYL